MVKKTTIKKGKKKSYKRSCTRCAKPFSSTRYKRCDKCRAWNTRYIRKVRCEKSQRNECYNCSETLFSNTKCKEHYFKSVSYRHFNHEKHWEGLADIWENQKGRCYYSGEALNPGNNLSLDHKLPSSKFPELSNDMSNLVWTTVQINTMKSDMLYAEFLTLIKRISAYAKRKNR